MKNIILNILLIGCIAVFIFSGWKLISALTEYRKGEKNYEVLLEKAVISPDTSNPTEKQEKEPEEEKEESLPVIDWDALKAMNEDLVGWIYIPGTKIHYPIVQGDDNDYYLTHTFDKSRNSCGAIFMDINNQADFSSDNTLLHGHNMKNKTMFGTLRYYSEKSYWEEHPYIWIIKENTVAKYEIFSTGRTEAGSDVYTLEFASEKSFQDYIVQRSKTGADYDTGVEVTTKDKLLTLSTCTSDTETGRRVVQARLIEEKVTQ